MRKALLAITALLLCGTPAFAQHIANFAAVVKPTGSPPSVTITIDNPGAAVNGQVGYGINGNFITGCEKNVLIPAGAVGYQIPMSCAYTGPVTPYYYDGATYYVPCNGAPQNNCPITSRIISQVLPWPAILPRAALTGDAVFTVDPVNGQDTNTGTALQPFRTMQRCADHVFLELDIAGRLATCQSVAGQTYLNGSVVVLSEALGQRDAADILFDWNGSSCASTAGVGYGCVTTGNWGLAQIPSGQLSYPRFAVRRVTLSGLYYSYGISGNGGQIILQDGITCGAFPGGYCLAMEGGGGAIISLYRTINVTGGGAALAMPYVGGDVVLQSDLINILPCTPGTPACGANGWPTFDYGIANVGGGNGGFAWLYIGSTAFTGAFNGPSLTVYPGGYAERQGSPIPALGGNGPCYPGGILNNVMC